MTAKIPIRAYIGYDPRQSVSFTCLAHSILRHSTLPVSITPLVIDQLPVPRDMVGLTPFTYTRYLTPWLAGFDGLAVFMDADMVMTGNIVELVAHCMEDNETAVDFDNTERAVWVVKHKAKFEWPSLMVFNAGHPANKVLTPDHVRANHKTLAGFTWLEGNRDSDLIGELPPEWNHLVLYDEPRPDAKLIHFTAGAPVWEQLAGCEHHETWVKEMQEAVILAPYEQVMGRSVHNDRVKQHMIAMGKLRPEVRDDGSAAPQ